MAIYKVQGPNGEIITIEGPDGANPDDVIAQAQALYKPREKTTGDRVKDFGKATASLADTALNAVTGTLDYAAYPLARAFGRTPEQATAETTSPKDVIGTAFGITQDPAYQGEASRQAMGAIGEGMQAVARPISTATGLPESDVSNMMGSAMLGAGVRAQPYINRGAQAVGQAMYAAEPYVAAAVKAPVRAPVQFGRGIVEGLVNKEYNPATSAMTALQDTYIPPAAAQRFMGEIPGVPPQSISQLQSQAKPTSELVGNRMGRVAQAISPKTLAGETLVPLQGQGMQAFGERVGRGVRTNPLQAMGEVGLTALTGVPFKTLAQGVGELGARYLGSQTGFAPGFQNRMTAAQQQAAQQQAFTPPPASGGGFTAPPGGYGAPPPPPGGGNAPIAPNQIPPVSPAEAAKQAALGRIQQQMSQAPGMTNPVNAEYLAAAKRYLPASKTPFEIAREQAAARIQPPKTPEQAAARETILDQIRSRDAQKAEAVAALQQRAQAAGGYTPPRVEAPVAPTDIPPTMAAPAAAATVAAPRPTDINSRLAALKANPDAVPPSQSLFENLPQYTEKEARMFETQQKNAPRGFGQGETVSEIEVMAAENQAARTGTKRDQTIADEMRKRLDRQTELGITHITKKEAAEGATLSQQRRGPPGVISMIPEEGTGTLKTGDARFNGGTYDNPLPHTQALDKIEMFEGFKDLLLPEQKVNIVGGTGTEKYIVRKIANGSLNRFYERKKTGNDKFNESIDDMTYADGGPNKIIWEHPSGYDYTFIGGTLERIVDNTNPATPTYTPTSKGWDKLPKVPVPDVIDIIRKIKE
jgi:hypothetical protein